MPTLCAPTPEITCFGCCPPIRPAHYDPLDYVSSLRREFAENRRCYFREGPRFRPIAGYYCWALGFLDQKGRRIGCLLHPKQNEGKDLRSFIDYGDKCSRESCLPARMLELLPESGQLFWLALADGLSSFYFSSPRSNPLFHLLLWGPHVLEPLRLQAELMHWTVTELLWKMPFLSDPFWNPRAHRYLFRLYLEQIDHKKERNRNPSEFVRSLVSLISSFPETHFSSSFEDEPYVHQLPLDSDFSDFLRLGLKRQRLSFEQACRLRDRIERTVPCFECRETGQ